VKQETIPLPAAAIAGPRSSGPLPAVALTLSALLWLVAWYGETMQAMAAIWWRSDTFAHGLLIFPISVWLIWGRRRHVAALPFRPCYAVLPLLALAGFGWLLAHLAGVGVVQQYCAVAMIGLTVWAILGSAVAWALAFPLAYLLFAVPFGEFLEPLLMEHTANFTVAALRLSGIPVFREGLFFIIPSGSWSVVEACSGLRYLIASLTLGLLYAYLTYRSLKRRVLFVAASIIVPIVANWVRAYMIVMIGHLSGMRYAVGVDHLIYGWLFFGVVMLLLFWIGGYWREDLEPAASTVTAAAPGTARSDQNPGPIAVATVAVAAIVAAWPIAAARLDDRGPYSAPDLALPAGGSGWQPVEDRAADWFPRYYNYQRLVSKSYRDGASRAGLTIIYYRQQRPGAQLVSTQNMLVSSSDLEWKRVAERARTVDAGAGELPVIESRLRGATNLLVWRWYWVDGQFVTNPYWAKVLQARSRLFGRGDDSAAVFAYVPYGEDPQRAGESLHAFVRAMLPAIHTTLQHARSGESKR